MGGGITLLQAQVDAHGPILFQNNTAEDGGAVKMLDDSRVSIYH